MKDMSFPGFLRQLWCSDWAEGKDAIPWDCTFQAGEDRDLEWERFRGGGGRTWYRSYVNSWVSVHAPPSIRSLKNLLSLQTELSNPQEPFHTPKRFAATPMWLLSWIMGGFDFHKIKPLPKFLADRLSRSSEEEVDDYLSEDFNTLDDPEGGILVSSETLSETSSETSFETSSETASEQDTLADGDPKPVLEEKHFANDGMVPFFSQWHPGDCEYVFSVPRSAHRSSP
jgi:hypothetical protein